MARARDTKGNEKQSSGSQAAGADPNADTGEWEIAEDASQQTSGSESDPLATRASYPMDRIEKMQDLADMASAFPVSETVDDPGAESTPGATDPNLDELFDREDESDSVAGARETFDRLGVDTSPPAVDGHKPDWLTEFNKMYGMSVTPSPGAGPAPDYGDYGDQDLDLDPIGLPAKDRRNVTSRTGQAGWTCTTEGGKFVYDDVGTGGGTAEGSSGGTAEGTGQALNAIAWLQDNGYMTEDEASDASQTIAAGQALWIEDDGSEANAIARALIYQVAGFDDMLGPNDRAILDRVVARDIAKADPDGSKGAAALASAADPRLTPHPDAPDDSGPPIEGPPAVRQGDDADYQDRRGSIELDTEDTDKGPKWRPRFFEADEVLTLRSTPYINPHPDDDGPVEGGEIDTPDWQSGLPDPPEPDAGSADEVGAGGGSATDAEHAGMNVVDASGTPATSADAVVAGEVSVGIGGSPALEADADGFADAGLDGSEGIAGPALDVGAGEWIDGENDAGGAADEETDDSGQG